MKIQDILFILLFMFLLYKRNAHYFVTSGLVLMLLAIPLFQFWIFFTAQRLVMYAAAFFLASTLFLLHDLRRVQ